MKAALPSDAGFRRLSLADQITANLREAIRSGRLSKHLPPERELCRMFNASRPVIRQSLHVLQDSGLLRIRTARRPEIIRKASRSREKGGSERVVLLFTEKRKVLEQWTLDVIDEIRRGLYGQGFHFDLAMEPGLSPKKPARQLQKLVEQYRANHWILAGASAPVQEWFRQQALNVISMGNSFPQTQIPFVNDDLRGTARHAAGVFLGLGHRQIVYLTREEGLAGEAEMEEGFREAFRSAPDAKALVVKHSGQVEQIRNRLEGVFSRKPRVTALLVSHAEDTLVAANWFLKQGIEVPRDVSLISFQWQDYLERLRPLPAWYYTDPRLHARKLCRLVLHPPIRKQSLHLIIPTFFKNGAVAAVSPKDGG